MPFFVPYSPPTYPPIKVTRAKVTGSGSMQGNSNQLNLGLVSWYAVNPPYMVAPPIGVTENALNVQDPGVLLGSPGFYGNSYIDSGFADGVIGLQLVGTIYTSYAASYYTDLALSIGWTGNAGVVQWATCERVNRNGTQAVAWHFDTGILAPPADYNKANINGSGTYGTVFAVSFLTYPSIGSTVYTIYPSPGLELRAYSF
jgi:hypothetical protein